MEEMRQLGWRKATFDEYVQWMVHKLEIYTNEAGNLGK